MRILKERRLRLVFAIAVVFFVLSYLRDLLSVENVADAVEEVFDSPPLAPGPKAWLSPPAPPDNIAEHKFMDDGLLEVNPAGIHPIFELIRRAEDAWKAKLRHASTTFPQAVVEYRRRYKRNPPKGFDDWCAVLKSIMIIEA
jgi:hypothetical protein